MSHHKSEIENALSSAMKAHAKWKLRLRTALTTRRTDISPEHAVCDDRCDFGKWLYCAGIDQETRLSVPYQVVRRLHAKFYNCAGQALEAAPGGKRRHNDSQILSDFDARSAKLPRAMSKRLGEVRV